MNESESFSMQSPAPDVLKWLTSGAVFSREKVTEFATSKKILPAISDYDGLKKIFESDLFITIFENKWKHHTGSQWQGRTATYAIHETMLHSISELSDISEVELHGHHQDSLSDMNRDQIDIMNKQLHFLADYYRSFWKGVPWSH